MIDNQPYYAVIFTSVLSGEDLQEYHTMADKIFLLAKTQEGFLDFESARETIGITVSYWKDLASIKAWKENIDHLLAQKLGREKWYSSYTVRICKVEREYSYND